MSRWIKIETSTPDKPELRQVARLCKATRAETFCAFFQLWSYFDLHFEDGFIADLSLDDIDDTAGLAGFGEALVAVGWLLANDGGFTIVNWERHNGQSAKKRAQSMRRMQSRRAANRWHSDE
jgi:hypothetical protein